MWFVVVVNVCLWAWVQGSSISRLSESSSILSRACADIEIYLALGVLVVGRWEGAVSPTRFWYMVLKWGEMGFLFLTCVGIEESPLMK
jgi:hypothetical protein